MKIGERYTKETSVTKEMLATQAFKEAPSVYGTPSLVAFIEKTAHEAMSGLLADGQTSVGMEIWLEHSSPTPLGMRVSCEVELTEFEKIFATFSVKAYDESGLICKCTHKRAIVERERIEAKAERKRDKEDIN